MAMESLRKAFKVVKDALVSKDKGALPFHMLLIGETGSGKTSFLNLMCNFNLVQKLGFDTSIEEFRAFNDISMENAEERQMESKTNDANYYTVQFDELTIGIIDTPGFGDTRGFEEDKKNVKRIVDRIKEKEHINCICLVINSRQARITAQLKYVLSEVSGILPKATINNLVVVLTNARDETDASFEVKELTPFLGKAISPDNVFYIDNPYSKWEKTRKKATESGITTASKQLARNLKSAFSDASETLASMFELVQSFEEVHTNSFMALYMVKQAVDKNTLDLMVASQNKTSLEKAISTKKKEIDEKVEAKTLNKDFLKTSIFKKLVQVNTKDHNTVCGYPDCNSNCHISCSLPKTLDKSSLKSCCCMKGNTCIICGHSYDSHFHMETLFKFEIEETCSVNEEQKKRFEEAEKDIENLSSIMKNQLDKDLRIAEQEMSDLSVKLLTNISEFEELGSTPSYVKLIECQITIVEQKINALSDENDKSNMLELQKTKKELEDKIQLVKGAKSLPWSDKAPKDVQAKWARGYLHVGPTATKQDIEKAYKEMALSKHPDKGGSDEEFKTLGRAHEILCK